MTQKQESQDLRYVRLAREHVPLLLSLEQEAYRDPWTEGMFYQETHNGASQFFVAYRGESLVGYAGFWFAVDEAHVTKVTVVAKCRRQGLGVALMGFLEEHARSLGARTVRLEVRESNLAARRLYERLGYVQTGLRKGYYTRSKETAVVMSKRLVPSKAARSQV